MFLLASFVTKLNLFGDFRGKLRYISLHSRVDEKAKYNAICPIPGSESEGLVLV